MEHNLNPLRQDRQVISHDIRSHELEAGIAGQVRQVLGGDRVAGRGPLIQASHEPALVQQLGREMRANEAGHAGNQCPFHFSLAQSMLLTRQVDGAVQATDLALTLTGGQDSERVRSRLGELRGALAASKGSQAISAADRIADLIHA